MIERIVPLPPQTWREWEPRVLDQMTELPCEQLRLWLSGEDLPIDDQRTKPADWILEALPLGEARRGPLAGLTAAMAKVMESHAAALSNRELDSLFHLAAGLAQPTVLADALEKLLDAVDLRDRFCDELPLTVSARYALQWNQVDDRWFDTVWRPMIRGNTEPLKWYIDGDSFDGLDGAVFIPEVASWTNQTLELALFEIVKIIAPAETRETDFVDVLERLLHENQFLTDDRLFCALQHGTVGETWMFRRWADRYAPVIVEQSGWGWSQALAYFQQKLLHHLSDKSRRGTGTGLFRESLFFQLPKSSMLKNISVVTIQVKIS